MDQLAVEPTLLAERAPDTPAPPDTSHLITEDDTPVDNWCSEKNQRRLTGALYDAQPHGIEPEE
ncbi:MAG TPA: hypothetical protein PKE45_24685 [Caldilineaceae bacterium]|nr:hypothetical protein [Caldilineaceae bacterium]